MSPGPVDVERPGDRQRLHVGPPRPVEVVGGAAQIPLQAHRVRNRRFLDERDRDDVRARLDRGAHAQPGFDRVAGVGRLFEQRRQVGLSAEGRQMNAFAVDRELHLMRVFEAAHDVQVRSIELDLEGVLAVERKRVAH